MFSTSNILLQRTGHPNFKDIDWNRLASSFAVIVDPLDPDTNLYLSRKEYESHSRIAMSNDIDLVVLAKGSDAIKRLEAEVLKAQAEKARPTREHDDKDTPPSMEGFYNLFGGSVVRPVTVFGRAFSTMRMYKLTGESTFKLTEANLRGLFHKWTVQVWLWNGGTTTHARGFRQDLYQITKYLLKRFRNEGTANFVLLLKVSLFAINSYLSGNPLRDTRPLGLPIELRHGLPAFLPPNT
jgi:hypothetical protein